MGNKQGNGRIKFRDRFIAGSWSAFASLIVIAIAIIINGIMNSLPTRSTQIDLTNNGLYSLSDQTKQLVSTLDKDVTLYLLASRGNEDATIMRFLNNYTSYSDHIKVENIDPNLNPTFLNKYDLDSSKLYQNSVIVDNGSRFRLIGYNEIFVTNYSINNNSGYEAKTSFAGENVVTNAIYYVNSDSLPKLYVLNGHGEKELSDHIKDRIKQENFEYESLSLLSLDSVPEDAKVLIINAPATDLNNDESQKIIDYLHGGGNVVLMTDYIEEGKMNNLLKVTAEMGLTVQQGLIIEGAQNKYISHYPHFIIPEIGSHEITKPLKNAGYYILVPIAQPLAEVESNKTSITWLLTTSSDSYAKRTGLDTNTVEKEQGDTDGPFHVGAVSVNTGKMVWLSSGNALEYDIDLTVAGGNSNLLLNTLNWMSSREEGITIRAKSLGEERLTVTAFATAFWSVVMIAAVPIGLCTAGVLIYVRRKRR